MARKEPKLQPASKDKKCQICGTEYTYPQKDSRSTRFHCELCAELTPIHRKVMSRMAKRIQQLERKLK
jgi:predicted aldo/keto reductase-like oxidoreductase